jgi:hypothetical protein
LSHVDALDRGILNGFTRLGLCVNNPADKRPFTEGVSGLGVNNGSPDPLLLLAAIG